MALFAYEQEVQQLLGDTSEQRFSLSDIDMFVNRSRRKIAGATQCIRVLPPSTGTILTITPTNGGTGYTAPVVVISAPDGIGATATQSQATATATQIGGVIIAMTVTFGGAGYVSPVVSITDPTGSGATFTTTLSAFVQATPGQEVYNFSAINPIIQASFPGVNHIIAVQSIAVSWGSWKPIMRQTGWSQFQAYCRAWNIGQENWPTIWAQYGQGENGSAYLFPIPSVIAQMDWDCYCSPIDLATDSDVEAIPHPFTEAVPYYAAYLAYLSAQNADAAGMMLNLFKNNLAEARSFSSPAVVPDFYSNDI